LVLSVIASGTARAEIPLGITATVGAGLDRTSGDDQSGGGSVDRAYSVKLDLGVRVRERWMIGAHGSFATVETVHRFFSDTIEGVPVEDDEWRVLRPLQLGVSALYLVEDRIYVSLWAGIHGGWPKTVCRTHRHETPSAALCFDSRFEPFGEVAPAFGFAIGDDLLVHGAHRLTVALSGSYALTSGDIEYFQYSYATLSIDLGYRFWAN
jgi:hypothetical protein